MKKILSILILLTMLLTALVGCKSDNTPNGGEDETNDGTFVISEGLSGTDVIKLLLASRRLDAQLLKNEGDIFENGSEVMQTLASRAKANLANVTLLSTTIEGYRGGKVEIDGDTFKWSNFVENCNSYDYFENITGNIVTSAEIGVLLIDNTKKFVRIVDKWVAIGEEKYYLHVDENSETIYSLRADQIDICRRYKNESGTNVYELYTSNEIAETRIYYVPGERYEWSERSVGGSNDATYFVADNSKGFWETLTVGETPDHYNVSCLVMKNDICYGANYIPEMQSIADIKMMSSDKATDIFLFTEADEIAVVSLHFGAFDGIDSVEITATPDKIETSATGDGLGKSVIYLSDSIEPFAVTTGSESAIINLKNGNRIVEGSSYANGNVTTGRALVGYGGELYTGTLDLHVSGQNDEEKLANLKAFLEETGLECRRDIDSIFGGIRRAYVELDGFISYYKWNGSKIATNESVSAAISEEDTRFEKMVAMYNAVKDAEVIDFTDNEAVELNINFSPVTVAASGIAKFENMAVTVEGLKLTVTDTTLYVENQAYIVNFALLKTAGEGDNIIHLTTENPTEIVYTEMDSFTVGTASASIEIPTLTAGEYTLVSYVATSDKIRASQYVPVVFTEISTDQIDLENATLIPAKNDKNEIIFSFVENIDINVTLSSESVIDYAGLHTLLAEEAYKYGIASDTPIEKYDTESDSYTALTGEETLIENGVYRLAYSVQNGNLSVNGHIYAEYIAPDISEAE